MDHPKFYYRNSVNDVRLFLILIPLINSLNYYLTYDTISLSWFTVATFCIDTLEGYAAWWAIRSIICYLDGTLPYTEAPLKRILLQLIGTSLSTVVVLSFLTELVNWLAGGDPIPLDFYTKTMFLFVIWNFVVNGIYTGLFFYDLWQQAEGQKAPVPAEEGPKPDQTGLMVRFGKKDLLLHFEEISGFYVDGEYTVVCNQIGEKYLLDQSLDKVEEQLPERSFFRVNRQYIIHRGMIRGFERADNSKIHVLLLPSPTLPTSVTASRLKAPAFKEWFAL
ncbi:LytTR family DNA-binding domain-containing protein [Telluribacter sp. SYSU D00476]|uniref:LytR/AlgR family response regulator transcription factor n=1 Tax=Telluribacter sp. SYSU D00476 TaxID=2811430 RepID=UPI001FF3CA62|nr:LytTR family DNA-binding domain-containing protein [Telluribacter sp. SYSU D00476]